MIPIIDDWVLIADDKCYTIARCKGKRTDKDGKEIAILTNQGYYTTLPAAFRGLMAQRERITLQGAFPGLAEAMRAVVESNERLYAVFAEINEKLEGRRYGTD